MKVHLVAICGTGMGSLAGLLKEAGHDVRGSDRAFYPPMSDSLRAWGIPTMEGFDPVHLDPDTDLVVVGNACRKDNPEAVAARDLGARMVSFPQALSELFIQRRRSIVAAGTHGKTTISSLLGYLLAAAGRDPSFLVGGIPLNFGKSFRLGAGEEFVVEGDEYDSAFFDKRPKFLHYRPHIAVLTSVEFDHADIYPDMNAYRKAFSSFLDLIPEEGIVLAYDDDPEVRSLVATARCSLQFYGLGPGKGWRARELSDGPDGARFRVEVDGEHRGQVHVPLSGRHNVANTLAVCAAADQVGVSLDRVSEILPDYRGVARRMQVRGEVRGVTVIDDFAHHPTAVRETVGATRQRFGTAQIVAVFEPRTNTSRRKVFQERYAESFDQADQVILVPPYQPEKIPEPERFDSARLVKDLQARGKKAALFADVDTVVDRLGRELGPGSVVLIMSNGAFDDIHTRLLGALGAGNEACDP